MHAVWVMLTWMIMPVMLLSLVPMNVCARTPISSSTKPSSVFELHHGKGV